MAPNGQQMRPACLTARSVDGQDHRSCCSLASRIRCSNTNGLPSRRMRSSASADRSRSSGGDDRACVRAWVPHCRADTPTTKTFQRPPPFVTNQGHWKEARSAPDSETSSVSLGAVVVTLPLRCKPLDRIAPRAYQSGAQALGEAPDGDDEADDADQRGGRRAVARSASGERTLSGRATARRSARAAAKAAKPMPTSVRAMPAP